MIAVELAGPPRVSPAMPVAFVASPVNPNWRPEADKNPATFFAAGVACDRAGAATVCGESGYRDSSRWLRRCVPMPDSAAAQRQRRHRYPISRCVGPISRWVGTLTRLRRESMAPAAHWCYPDPYGPRLAGRNTRVLTDLGSPVGTPGSLRTSARRSEPPGPYGPRLAIGWASRRASAAGSSCNDWQRHC